jgi:hypothetical protein
LGRITRRTAAAQNASPYGGFVGAMWTVTFLVPDIDDAIDELTGRGVSLGHYTTVTPTDARGIHRNPSVRPVAWFKDPAGNTLSLNET